MPPSPRLSPARSAYSLTCDLRGGHNLRRFHPDRRGEVPGVEREGHAVGARGVAVALELAQQVAEALVEDIALRLAPEALGEDRQRDLQLVRVDEQLRQRQPIFEAVRELPDQLVEAVVG